MRAGFRTIAWIALCAATAAAALAHFAIDVIGDYALRHDTYDDVAHDSRELVTGVAILLACVLLVRGLRMCLRLANERRGSVSSACLPARIPLLFGAAVVSSSACIVPAMEWLDCRLAAVPVRSLADAFGGSLLLGLGTTIACAVLIASIAYAIFHWLISHRDRIACVLATLMRRNHPGARPRRHDLARCASTPRRKRTAHALRRCKRGPPRVALAS